MSSRLPRKSSNGFTIVELMVAMLISVLLLGGVLSLFSNSRATYEANDRLARIQENGRYALELIARDIRAAGYQGCAHRTPTNPLSNLLNDSTDLLWNFGLAVNGFQAAGGSTWTPALVAPVDASLPDRDGAGPDVAGPTPNSDVIVLRGPVPGSVAQRLQNTLTSASGALEAYNSTANSIEDNSIVFAASCDKAAVFQVDFTPGASAADPDQIQRSATATTPGNASTNLGIPYARDATEIYPVRTVVYFLDGSPNRPGSTSLWRIVADGRGAPAVEEVVEGIDTLQAEYGRDTNNDRLADEYVAAGSVTDWSNVVSVRIALLARSLDEYGNRTDDQARTILGASIPAFNDRRQRQVFTTTATIRNNTL